MKEINCGHPVAFLRSGSCLNRAYLLAGGESRRMGQDKLFLPYGENNLLEHGLARLSKRFNTVKIAARTEAKFRELDYEVVIDSPNAKGPMAGLIAALEDCPDATCFVVAVDLPDISATLIDRIIKNYSGEDYFGVAERASDSEDAIERIQPLCGIWSKRILPIIYRLANEHNYRLTDLLNQIRTATVNPETENWRNLNSPSDLNWSGEING